MPSQDHVSLAHQQTELDENRIGQRDNRGGKAPGRHRTHYASAFQGRRGLGYP